MDPESKKTVLRMIPYGLYVIGARAKDGTIAASTVNWVTQSSFDPPMIAAAVKPQSGVFAALSDAGAFTLNILGKDQADAAFAFFKETGESDGQINGQNYREGIEGAPLLTQSPAAVECRVKDVVEQGDHHVVVAEVVNVIQNAEIDGRPDDATLVLKDLGDSVYYGG